MYLCARIEKNLDMENFKEIAEKVLSGELKGTFVLRNGCTRNSKLLARNKNGIPESFPYYLVDCGSLTDEGRGYETIECEYDVINFISEEDEALLKMFNDKLDSTKNENTDADELFNCIADFASKVRTETILGHKYITGFICHDGSELSFTELIGNK